MATNRQHPLRAIGRQIRSIPRVPAFGTQEEDHQTWARVVRSRENLPEIYQEFFR